MLMKTVGQRIRDARTAAQLKQPELAAKCGWTQSRISNYERGERQPGLDDLAVIAKALNIPVQELAFNQVADQIIQKSYTQNIDTNSPNQVKENAAWFGGLDLWDSKTPLSSEEVVLPFYMEVELAAGSGSVVQLETDGPKLRFARSTLRKAGVEPEHAACVKVTGDSMEPVLPNGSTVGIDMLNKAIRDGKMYAINHDGMLRVKLLYRLPGGGLRVKSYNAAEFPEEVYSAEDAQKIEVIGRVFWSSVMW